MPSQRWLRGPGRRQACRLGWSPRELPWTMLGQPRLQIHGVARSPSRGTSAVAAGGGWKTAGRGGLVPRHGCRAGVCRVRSIVLPTSPARRGLLPSPGAACTGSNPCRKSPACDGENATKAREHGEGWLEGFFHLVLHCKGEGKAVPPRRKVGCKKRSPPLPCSAGAGAPRFRETGPGGPLPRKSAPATGTCFCRSGCAANAHLMGAPELPEKKPSPPENPRPPKRLG